MGKYTAEQVESYVICLDARDAHVEANMLRDYAALLRERESAKVCPECNGDGWVYAGSVPGDPDRTIPCPKCESAKAAVTDEVVERACEVYFGKDFWPEATEEYEHCRIGMRAALEAVAPMLVSADQQPVRYECRRKNRYTEEWYDWVECQSDSERLIRQESPEQEWEFRSLYAGPMLANARVTDGFVLAPIWKLERASEVLERDGDEHGVGADIRAMLAAAGEPNHDA